MESGYNSEHHAHDLLEELVVDWQTPEKTVEHGETKLSVYLEWEEEPLKEAKVVFEIWKHGDETHQWLETEEEEPGTYVLQHTFENAGDYHIVVHIENADIHEHIDQTIKVLKVE